MVDPPAGAWFTQQALQLAQNATPPLFQSRRDEGAVCDCCFFR
jgi:hypothetical protein